MIKIRAKFKKVGDLKYISHLDLMRLFDRGFRRANIPVEYTQGFNPHQKFSFATALSLGVSSDGEYMDIELNEKINIEHFITKVNNTLPEGVKILDAKYVQDNKSIMSRIRWSQYIIECSVMNFSSKEKLESQLNNFLENKEIIIKKEKKKKNRIIKREENIRSKIKDILVLTFENKGERVILKTTIKTGSQGNLKPDLLLQSIEQYTDIKIKKDNVKIHRLELFIENKGKTTTPL